MDFSATAPLSRLVLLCGLSFSGKSTLATALEATGAVTVVSLDAMNEERGLHSGEGVPIAEWQRTHSLAHQRVREILRRGGTAVVDDTSSLRFLRDAWRRLAAEESADFLLVFLPVDPSVQRRRLQENRDTLRRGDVTDEVLACHLADFEMPQPDESPLILTAEQIASWRDPHKV